MKTITTCFALTVLCFAIGCDKAPDGFPAVVPCKISLVKSGKPIPAATIMLVSDGAKEWFASGETDAAGLAAIQTILGNYTKSGVPEGTYKITLSQIPQIKDEKSQQELFDMSPAEKNAYKVKRDKIIKESRSFPLEFESHLTTPITVEITKGQSDYSVDVDEFLNK